MNVHRRRRPRFMVGHLTPITIPQGTIAGLIQNMNGKGALIHCRDLIASKEKFSLQVEFPRGSSTEVSCEVA